jgi:hypothetical protein
MEASFQVSACVISFIVQMRYPKMVFTDSEMQEREEIERPTLIQLNGALAWL